MPNVNSFSKLFLFKGLAGANSFKVNNLLSLGCLCSIISIYLFNLMLIFVSLAKTSHCKWQDSKMVFNKELHTGSLSKAANSSKRIVFLLFITLSMLTGCSSALESSKYQFNDGFYRIRLYQQRAAKVYADVEEDSVTVYPILKKEGQWMADTSRGRSYYFAEISNENLFHRNTFSQHTFDVDFLTILLKYRPSTKELPHQLTTDLNGALYLGYRIDIYRFYYPQTPLFNYRKRMTHYGYSLGFIGNLGSTAITPWVTNNRVVEEYDGILAGGGIAGIMGINNFTIGLAIGADTLLDRNRTHWIYRGKPWLGLTLGLNLN